jgi:protein O-mannosyl-transferase
LNLQRALSIPPRLLIGAAILLLATLAVYWPAVHADFIWDDDDILTANPLISAPGGLRLIWAGGKFYDYWPLTLTSFWCEWRLWGPDATGYHVTNILLHAAAAVLLWRVLRHLGIPAAWLAALIFAIHPINVQSVAWITERKNTLSLFFFGLALLAYLRSEKLRVGQSKVPSLKSKVRDPQPSALNPQRVWYALSFVAFVLALLSKTSVVMLPVVLLLCTWWLGRPCGRSLAWADVRRTVPFFAVALVLALVTIYFQYQHSIGTDVVATGGFRARLVGAGMAVWFYLARIIFPRHPMFVYPRWNFSPDIAVNYLPAALLLGAWMLCWWYRNRWARPLFFALSYFLLMLFPVLGFFRIYFQKYSFVADHWLYPAMIGIIALIVGGAAWLVMRLAEAGTSDRPRRRPRSRNRIQAKTEDEDENDDEDERSKGCVRPRIAKALGALAAAAVIAALAPLTWAQCGIYQNEETLWRATLQRNPRCWLAHHNLASLIVAESQKELSSSVGVVAGGGPSPALTDKLNEALFHEHVAIAWKSDHAAAEYGAGHILCLLNKTEEAVPHFRRAVEMQPDMVSALDSLAWILATHEKAAVRNAPEAVRLATSAVAFTGEQDPRILDTLAVASAEAGDFPAAIQAAQKALKLAVAADERELAGELAGQLRLFQSGRAVRSR